MKGTLLADGTGSRFYRDDEGGRQAQSFSFKRAWRCAIDASERELHPRAGCIRKLACEDFALVHRPVTAMAAFLVVLYGSGLTKSELLYLALLQPNER